MTEFNPDKISVRVVLGVCAAVLLFYAVGISGGSHFDSDDVLYSQMAREMVQTGNWVDNQWSDSVLFEKPPLYLWCLATSGAVFGWSEFAMRLPGTLFAIGGLLALFLLVRTLGGSRLEAITAVGLLAGSYLFLMLTRRIMMDVPVLAFCLGAALCVVRNKPIGFGALAGAAVLTKGLAAGPMLLAPVIYGVIHKHFTRRNFLISLGVGLLVSAPWHIIQTIQHGSDFWSGYIGYHVGDRASSQVVPGLDLVEMTRILLHERLLLIMGLVGVVPGLIHKMRRRLELFMVLWLAFAAVPILLSATRLPHYLLPLTPALATLTCCAFPRHWWENRLAPLAAAAGIAAAFFAHEGKLSFWLNPDFDPDPKAIGTLLVDKVHEGDLVGTYNLTTSSLTHYADQRFEMFTDNKGFHLVQSRVLMIQRSGVLHWIKDKRLPTVGEGKKRYFVSRQKDRIALINLMKSSAPNRKLSEVTNGRLVLINDAALGTPIK